MEAASKAEDKPFHYLAGWWAQLESQLWAFSPLHFPGAPGDPVRLENTHKSSLPSLVPRAQAQDRPRGEVGPGETEDTISSSLPAAPREETLKWPLDTPGGSWEGVWAWKSAHGPTVPLLGAYCTPGPILADTRPLYF